jgi:hypothetical protein
VLATTLTGKNAEWRLNLAGRRGAASRLDCIRRAAAAMSAKAPPSRKEREKGGAPAFGCGEAWASPQRRVPVTASMAWPNFHREMEERSTNRWQHRLQREHPPARPSMLHIGEGLGPSL